MRHAYTQAQIEEIQRENFIQRQRDDRARQLVAPPTPPARDIDPGTGRRKEDKALTERIERAKIEQRAKANRCECGYLICSCGEVLNG